jgi:hypothetical protein
MGDSFGELLLNEALIGRMTLGQETHRAPAYSHWSLLATPGAQSPVDDEENMDGNVLGE